MKFKLFYFVSTIILFAGCGGTTVQRVAVEQVVDYSGRWNDTDAQMVSKDMIKDCLEGKWLANFTAEKGQQPVVIVGTIENKSSEHINADVFIKSLESELISSGKVRFVADKGERLEVREERKDQQESGYTDPKTIKPKRKEIGADFILKGTINAVVDETHGKYVVLYQVNLELIDLATNEIKWLEQTELKKLVTKTKYSM